MRETRRKGEEVKKMPRLLAFPLPLVLAAIVISAALVVFASCRLSRRTVTLPVGTLVPALLQTRLGSDVNREGDRFVARVPFAVPSAEGPAIPPGARIIGEVSELARDPRSTGMSLRVTGLELPGGRRVHLDTRRIDVVAAPAVEEEDGESHALAWWTPAPASERVRMAGSPPVSLSLAPRNSTVVAVATGNREIELRPGWPFVIKLLSPARIPVTD